MRKRLAQNDGRAVHAHLQRVVDLDPGVLQKLFRQPDALTVAPLPDLYFHSSFLLFSDI